MHSDFRMSKSRQASNEKVKRSSSSAATQSVKRRIDKFQLTPTTPLAGNKVLFQNFPPFFFSLLKNSCMKPAYNKSSVIFEGVIRCSRHFNLGD